ncbi:hypothetical protein AVEN_147726-1 [Araneus ventricosus]|uniref:Uncharacterized protein n=1 Tax=Araneus ventricosus TaxID=182803 RepID=A0A4Y2T248_ARAVE|nr:hypothetical protein AVEN_268108-1 [Araneus ventricosus]GBO24539.1 hypothetical protein AVEN_147726-1 [Araneus ventricosus]
MKVLNIQHFRLTLANRSSKSIIPESESNVKCLSELGTSEVRLDDKRFLVEDISSTVPGNNLIIVTIQKHLLTPRSTTPTSPRRLLLESLPTVGHFTYANSLPLTGNCLYFYQL